MAKLIFRTHDQATIVPAVEAMLRQELGPNASVTTEVLAGDKITGRMAANEILRAALGGRGNPINLFSLHFTVERPRSVELYASINKQGVGSYAGDLLYAVRLTKPVGQEVGFDRKAGGRFAGDTASSARLNTNADLLKRIDKFLRNRMQAGAVSISLESFLKIVPDSSGSMIVALTLPRSINLGFGSTLDAGELVDIASVIEATL